MTPNKRHTLFFLVLVPIIMSNTNSIAAVQATGYNIAVEVSSPVQNKTYNTNDVPLRFSYGTNVTNSPNIANYSVVFCYNLDGEPTFGIFETPIFGGNTTRIGQFYQPVPLEYNSTIQVPNGNHSLFVHITFWITPEGEYENAFKVQNVSQVVNFTVNPTTPPIPEFPSWIIFPILLIGTVSLTIFRKKITSNTNR